MGPNGQGSIGAGIDESGHGGRDTLVLSVAKTAVVLGISDDLVYELIVRGELPCLRFGRRRVVPRRAIELVIERAMDGFDRGCGSGGELGRGGPSGNGAGGRRRYAGMPDAPAAGSRPRRQQLAEEVGGVAVGGLLEM